MKPTPPDTLQVSEPTFTPPGLRGGGGAVEARTTGVAGSGPSGRGAGTTGGAAFTPASVTSAEMAQLVTGVSVSTTGTPATKSLRDGFAGAFAAASTRLAA